MEVRPLLLSSVFFFNVVFLSRAHAIQVRPLLLPFAARTEAVFLSPRRAVNPSDSLKSNDNNTNRSDWERNFLTRIYCSNLAVEAINTNFVASAKITTFVVRYKGRRRLCLCTEWFKKKKCYFLGKPWSTVYSPIIDEYITHRMVLQKIDGKRNAKGTWALCYWR